MKIGFFDSGLGGLIILKAVAAKLPQYDYEFYGDTAHVPYGDRTEEDIFQLTKVGVEHLFARDCALVIIACNTASAETTRRLQDTVLVGDYMSRRILGVIIPTVEAVVEEKKVEVALIATKRTVESKKYEIEFAKLALKTNLLGTATPGLVPLIESGKREEAIDSLADYISKLPSTVDALILGCTHYCLLKEELRGLVGGGVTVFSQDEIIPDKLASYLSRHPEITDVLTTSGTRNIFLTDNTSKYDGIISTLLGGLLLPE